MKKILPEIYFISSKQMGDIAKWEIKNRKLKTRIGKPDIAKFPTGIYSKKYRNR